MRSFTGFHVLIFLSVLISAIMNSVAQFIWLYKSVNSSAIIYGTENSMNL